MDMNSLTSTISRIDGEIKTFIDNSQHTIRELSERLVLLEQSGTGMASDAFQGFDKRGINRVTDEISKSQIVSDFLEKKTRAAGVPLNTKDLLPALNLKNTVTSDAATNPAQQLPGVVGGPVQRVWLRQFLSALPATSNSFVYTREGTFTNNAAEQSAEGASKAESSITFSEETGVIVTVAHWLRLSRQVLSDNAALGLFIENRMKQGLELRIEQQLINGDGTSGNMSGILDTGNFTAFTPISGDTAVDSLRKAKLALEAADYQAGLILLNPSDLADAELLKDAQDRYIVGRPVMGGLSTIWGVPVHATTAITAGTFAILDLSALTLFQRENSVVELSDSDSDNFTQNLITMRAETRLGLSVSLPAGIRSGNLTL